MTSKPGGVSPAGRTHCNRMRGLDYLIIATYLAQAIQVVFFPVPSAGSTLEMLFKVRKRAASAAAHPAAGLLTSPVRLTFSVLATTAVLCAAAIPLAVLIFPQIRVYLLPLFENRPSVLTAVSALFLLSGNVITFVAGATLRRNVRFHEFSEADRLHTAGIYGIVRNPITLGLTAVFAGFLLAQPSVAMLAGFLIFVMNSNYRVRMEEVYLRNAFGEDYLRYQNGVGKYFPKALRTESNREDMHV